ncbi:protein FAM216A [Myripristis murdjan]|nr:protein FAM216A [Myripristis murdjan]
MKTIHIPKSMMTAPFLQHPALTTGQRRYLLSIANVYSTEHMRRQMKQHYLNVLHTCIKTGQSSMGRKRYGDHPHKDKCTFQVDAEKDVGSRTKPQGQRKSSRGTAHSELILPKIVKR